MTQWEENWQSDEFRKQWLTPSPEVVRLLPLLRAHGVKAIVDIGCGIGRHAHLFASEGFSIIGTDYSESAIAHCQDWFAGENLTGEFRTCDMAEIADPPGSVDAVVAFNSIYHTRRTGLETIIARIFEVLRPGGLFYGTFIDKENRKYGLGIEFEPHTFAMPEGFEANVPHLYLDEADLREIFAAFEVLELNRIQQTNESLSSFKTSSKLAVTARRP